MSCAGEPAAVNPGMDEIADRPSIAIGSSALRRLGLRRRRTRLQRRQVTTDAPTFKLVPKKTEKHFPKPRAARRLLEQWWRRHNGERSKTSLYSTPCCHGSGRSPAGLPT